VIPFVPFLNPQVLTPEQTQALLDHHVRDAYEGIEKGSRDVAYFSIEDAEKILKTMPRSWKRVFSSRARAVRQAKNAVRTAFGRGR
jgi:hypothetical protein